jgi:DNA-binding MarR family transcriptional regulator
MAEHLEVASLIRRAVAALARRLRGERVESGLSLTKLSVLGRLYRKGSLTAVELAAQERIQPQSLTRVLAELTDEGLISRRADVKDGRRQLLDITGDGRSVLIQDVQQRDAWLAGALATELSATERELLRLAAGLMERIAEEAPGAERGGDEPPEGGAHEAPTRIAGEVGTIGTIGTEDG